MGKGEMRVGVSAYATPADAGGATVMKAREIRQVTRKRQVTIPKEMYDALGIKGLVEFQLLDDDALLVRPVRHEGFDLSVSILTDLLQEGFSGQGLIHAFQERKAELAGVIERLNKEVDEELRKNPNSGRQFMKEILSGHEGDA